MRHKFLVTIFLITSLSLYSSAVKFHSVNFLYGISMREVTSICKDKNGFIWTSSKAGILRLSGDDSHIYQLPYENADIISVRLVYSNSSLIAYTNNGQLFRYNEIDDKFELIVSLTKVLHNKYIAVNRVLLDTNGYYWFATSYGLYRYQTGHLIYIKDTKNINYLTWCDSNRLFVAKSDGIWLMNIHTRKKEWLYKLNQKFDLGVSRLFYDAKAKRLWIGTNSKGLFYYDMDKHLLSKIQISTFPKQPILAMVGGSDTSIFIGVDGQGIWEINRTGTKILNIYKEDVNDPSSLRGNGVYDIYNDQNKRIWICTYSGGVSFFDKASPMVDRFTHTINSSNSLANNNVNKILQTKSGDIWLATDNGISCKEKTTGNWKTFYQNKQDQAQVFISLCEDDKGRIWAGTYSSGIYVLDERTGRELAHYSTESPAFLLENNFVMDIFKDSQGDLWIGGVHGNLICYLSKENKFRTYSQQPIFAFAEISPTQLLLACTYGLCLLDKTTGKINILVDGYLVQDMTVIKENIWICTSGEGLIRYNWKTRKIQKFTTSTGLPSNYINSILYDSGYLWLGTESGMCRFDPKSKGVLTYSTIYSLSSVSFNRNANYKLNDGKLIWGTSNGAVLFLPSLLTEVHAKGAVYFQDLALAGHSIRSSLSTPLDSLKKISLDYNQNTLHLELLSIGNVPGAKFSWMFEGLDNVWSQPTENRFIHYSNIPSGNYVLKIRLYDSSLSHVITERSLEVSVVPPFWSSWWFELVLFLLVISIIYLSLRYYINRLNKQHAEEKVRAFTNTAHDFRTSLTLIKAPIEELSKEQNLSELGGYYLSLATEQALRLSTAVTQLMDFQKVDLKKDQLTLRMVDIVELIKQRRLMFESYAKIHNITLEFASDQDSYQTAVDESMMEKVIDNLISNAIKYSNPESQIHIKLNCKPESWMLEVKDTGIGISKKAQTQLFKEFYRGENAINSKIVGSGIGLLLVKNYVEMHNGNISYVSKENEGSAFKVVIPIKEVSDGYKTSTEKLDESVASVLKGVDLLTIQPQADLPKQTMRILIVEDNDDLRNFMQYPLQVDFDVLLAQDGVEAWDIIQKEMPDLVISDVMMPNMDGFELCSLLKSTYETSHIPFILLTALSGKAEQLHGLGLGADDYLTKPFDMTLLVQRIKSIIRNREAVKEKALKLIKVSGSISEQILNNEHNDRFVKKIMEVVRANMANTEFGKDDFAAAMNVSASLLYKKVKTLTDQSPSDFIKMVRLDYALELLQSHKHTVTEISEYCGFSSIGYFSTVFKKHFGKSPNEI